ncbi:MAG: hypothetical protein HQM08_20235 [Candidatus Riflebacteria bacterium]|nr:hypothetical protein [Candidatus Riflebacteria bacterium]
MFADPPAYISNVQSITTNPPYGGDVATIGAKITYTLTTGISLPGDDPVQAWITLWDGGPSFLMAPTLPQTPPFSTFTTTYTVPEGTWNSQATPFKFQFVSTGSPTSPVSVSAPNINQIKIDNMRPKVSGPMTVQIRSFPYSSAPISWTGQWIKKDDKVILTQAVDTTAYQAGESAVVDVSSLQPGAGNTQQALSFDNGNKKYVSPELLVESWLDNSGSPIDYHAVDLYGNATDANPILLLPVDTTPATITSIVFNPATTSVSAYKANDTVTITVNLQGHDSDSVIASCTWLSPSGINLPYISGNAPAIFQKTITVYPSPPATRFAGPTPCDFIVTDKAGNITTSSVQLNIDNTMPLLPNQPTAAIIQTNGKLSDSVGIIGDRLILQATATFSPSQSGKVFIDLSPLGPNCPSALEIPGAGVAGSYGIAYTLPAGIAEDPDQRTFTVTAKDMNAGGNVVASWTTPPIIIDNTPPVISNTSVTRLSGTAGKYKIGDQFQISARVLNLDGAELGAVGVNVASLSSLYTSSTPLTRNSADPSLFEGIFTVGSFTDVTRGWNGVSDIKLIASDAQGNLATASVSTIDPIYNVFPDVLATTWSVNPPLDSAQHSYVRVGDSVTLLVQLSQIINGETVVSNLSSVNGSANQSLTYDGIGTYTYTWKIATGSLNNGATFPVTISDSGGNSTVKIISIQPYDDSPPSPGSMIMTGKDWVDSPNAVNIGDQLNFRIPLTLASPDDHGTATIDLSRVGGPSAATMTFSDASYSVFFTATNTSVNLEETSYSFTAVITDKAGNYRLVQNGPHVVDCWPPKLLELKTGIREGVSTATIGMHVELHAHTAEEDTGVPYVDLSAFGLSATTYMTGSSTPHWWDYSLAIATGGASGISIFDNKLASWSVTIKDDAGNIASMQTANVGIDNNPPIVNGAFTVSPSDKVKLGDTLTFSLPVSGDIGTATVNLVSIGRLASSQMSYSAPNFTLSTTTALTTVEYTNYVFQATITDSNGNKVIVNSNPVNFIDCLPPAFANGGINISQTNSDNPNSLVANINDTLTVYASMSYYADAIGSATLIASGVQVATATMKYVSARNRHEATFVVPKSGSVNWGDLNESPVSFILTATDDVGNVATSSSGAAAFTIDNLTPIINGVTWTVYPSIATSTFNGEPVINVGSGTTLDLLWASATIDTNISDAFFNLSAYPGGPSKFAIAYSGQVASSSPGVSLSDYSSTNWTHATFSITLKDQGGNSVISSQSFYIDTRRPQLTDASFNGSILTLTYDEEIWTFDPTQFEIWGSTTAGISTFTALSTYTPPLGLFSVDLPIPIASRTIMTTWASQSLYLRAKTGAAVTDFAGNWCYQYDRFPITLTSTAWREPPRINSLVVTQTWPASPSVILDFYFSKSIAPGSLVASNGVLFVTANDFSTVDYRNGYVFQPTDAVSWPGSDNTQLRITLASDSAAWVAKKLGNGTTTLKFATRSGASVFLKDDLQKPMGAISSASPVSAGVTRPYTVSPPPFAFNVESGSSGTSPPILDISGSKGLLKLNFSDDALLYSNDFETIDQIIPKMGMPIPTYIKRTTAFHGKIALFDSGVSPATSINLTFEPLSQTRNGKISSKTVTLELTDTDLQNMLAMFKSNATPSWQLQVQSGAFSNWWSQPNQAYGISEPGFVQLATPTPHAASCTLAAVAFSDPSPTKYHSAGDLTFECELFPGTLGNSWIPIASTTPTVQILRQDNSTVLTTGTFLGWGSRQVTGETAPRAIARFKSTSNLPQNVERIPAEIKIDSVYDIFSNKMDPNSNIGSFVFDLSARNDSTVGGFNTASAALVIDSRAPLVVSVTPSPGPIGQTSINGRFFDVTFDESMDTTTSNIPFLQLATTGQTLTFNFQTWINSSQTARFTNAQAITPATLNGIWTYQVASGYDPAGNMMGTPTGLTLEIRSASPEPTIEVQTRQPQLSSQVLVGQPLSLSVGDGTATIKITYPDVPSYTPHNLQVFDANDVQVATLTPSGINPLYAWFPGPSANWVSGRFPSSNRGPETYRFKIINSLGSISSFYIGSIIHDSKPAQISSFAFDDGSKGLSIGGIRYYSSALGSATITIQSDATDSQRLTIASTSSQLPQVYDLTKSGTTHSAVFGGSLDECLATFTMVDLAGNFATGVKPTFLVKVDKTSPTVISVSPSQPIGPSSPGQTTFDITFSEEMNTAVVPTVTLSTGSTIIHLQGIAPSCWLSSTTCRLTNQDAIVELPISTYTYQISNAKDYAGNAVLPSNFQVYIFSKGTPAITTVLTRQPGISPDLFTNQPFSPYVGASSATVVISFSPAIQVNPPYRLLVYDTSDVNVATFSISSGNPGSAIFSNNASLWASGAAPGTNTGPQTYRFKLLDTFGNISTSYIGSIVYDSKSTNINSFSFNDGGRGIATNGIRYYAPVYGSATVSIQGDNTDSHRLVFASNPALLPVLFPMTVSGNTHSVVFGSGISECVATLSVVDWAGNLSTGSPANMTVRFDRTAPIVTTASPSMPIGVREALKGIFDISFSEPMQQGIIPTATLENSFAIINLQPISSTPWISSTVCRFTNRDAIKDLPIGTYTYFVSGARDLAGIDNLTGSAQVYIHSTSASATVTIFTKQPQISSDVLSDQPFSTKVGDGSATVQFDFSPDIMGGSPFNMIVCDQNNVPVATLPISAGNTGFSTFPGSFSNWASNKFPALNVGPINYQLKVSDKFGNLSTSLKTLIFDSNSPSINTFTVSDGGGIATLSPDLQRTVRYHSPALGHAVISLGTNSNDSLRLLVGPSLKSATTTFALTGGGSTSNYSLELDTTTFPETEGILRVADLAGNTAIGAHPTLGILIDQTSPTVKSVSPTQPIGAIQAGNGVFDFTFSERMNTAVAPNGQITSGSVSIRLQATAPGCWISPYISRMTNLDPILNIPPSTYSWQISGAVDYAGNANLPCTQQIFINSTAPSGQVIILTKQPRVSNQIFQNQPYSSIVGESSATVLITFPSNTNLTAPYSLLVYDSIGVNVATFPVDLNAPVKAIFSTNSVYWASGKTPGTNVGPISYNLSLIDGLKNISSQPIGTLVFDTKSSTITALQFDDGGKGEVLDGVRYYSPNFGSASIQLQSDQTEVLRMVLASTSAYLPELFPTSFNGISFQGAFGGSLAETVATVTFVDPAGNSCGGVPSILSIRIDRTPPQITTIIPSGPIGSIDAGNGVFDIQFSEKMQTSSVPTVFLQKDSTVINMKPISTSPWISRTVCRFTNSDAIRDVPVGTYTFAVSGAKDLSGQENSPSQNQIYINSTGLVPSFTVLTKQPNLFKDILTNQPFSTLVGDGSATISLLFTADAQNVSPLNLQVFDDTNSQVATLPISWGMPATSVFPSYSSNWISGKFPLANQGPISYRFKVIDRIGNVSSNYIGTLVFDSLPANVSSLSLDDGNKGVIQNGIKYFSPALGTGNLSAQTDSADSQRLIISYGSGFPTSFVMTPNGNTHSFAFNSSIPDGIATMTLADLAGNPGLGASLSVVFDSTQPKVVSVIPATEIGPYPALSGQFDIKFSEAMNPNVVPTVTLQNGNISIPLVQAIPAPGCWIGSQTVRLTNQYSLTDFPQGKYSYIISGAADLAGNSSVNTNAGDFTLTLNPVEAAYVVTFSTRQQTISNTLLVDKPFSPVVSPFYGTLSVTKQNSAPGIPSEIRVFDSSNNLIATTPLLMSANVGTATVNAQFFNNPGKAGPIYFNIKIADNLGGVSNFSKAVTYDGLEPTVNSVTFNNATALGSTVWYSPTIKGDLSFSVQAGSGDPLNALLVTPTGTQSYPMTKPSYYYSGRIPAKDFSSLADGQYSIYFADDAGNLATGPANYSRIYVDRVAPGVTNFKSFPATPLKALGVGLASFTVTFNEKINQSASTTPQLSLASGSYVIKARLANWNNEKEAVFVNDDPITGSIPQGKWDVVIKAWDPAENVLQTQLPGLISINSQGPAISDYSIESYQQTTATLPFPQGTLNNTPFSMGVWPYYSTLKISVSGKPSEPVYLHFMSNGFSVASYPVSFANGKTQFVWSSTRGPVPTVPTSYQIKLVDSLGNESTEIPNWTVDSLPPSINSVSISGGSFFTNTGERYFNPQIHGSIGTNWLISGESNPPLLRITGNGATQTLALAGSGTSWNSTFTGKKPDGTNLPDGEYYLDIVDVAGNVGNSASPAPSSISVIIDTQAPSVSTITTKVNGTLKDRFSPTVSGLEISLTTSESISPTGVWNVIVKSSSGITVKRLTIGLLDSGGIGVIWDGTGLDGKIIGDGSYRIYITDFAGNSTTDSALVTVVKNDFKVTSVNQLTSKSLKVTFNQDVDPNSVTGSAFSFDPQGPIVNSVSLIDNRNIEADMADTFSNGVSYKVTLNSGSISSIDGIPITDGKNSGKFTADSQGPVLSKVGFEGISNNRDFILYFSEVVDKTSAEDVTTYVLTLGTKKISITRASVRSDNASVLLSAAEDLSNSNSYKIGAYGIADKFGNLSQGSTVEKTFNGIDLTPPQLLLYAFSNPANEQDLMIVLSSNEDLSGTPVVTLTQSGGSPISITMNPGTRPRYYMGGARLDPNFSGSAEIQASANDLSGNTGKATFSFSAAIVSANLRASLISSDGKCSSTFDQETFKEKTMVTLIEQPLYKNPQINGSLIVPLPINRILGTKFNVVNNSTASITLIASNTIVSNTPSNNSELEIQSSAYEISFGKTVNLKPFTVSISISEAKSLKGLGIFALDTSSNWQWINSSTSGHKLTFRAITAGVYSIMKDFVAPSIVVTTKIPDFETISTDRPKFSGVVSDSGSGIAPETLKAVIDGVENPITDYSGNGSFTFIPQSPLLGGKHELAFKVSDNTGNTTVSPALRFEIKTALRISEVSAFPNPAKEKSIMRICGNRSDLSNLDNEIRIYDVAGHVVRTLDLISPVRENFGLSARFIYEIPWDLRNEDGKKVANGIYIAKIKISDPDNTGNQVKKTQKIVVLR